MALDPSSPFMGTTGKINIAGEACQWGIRRVRCASCKEKDDVRIEEVLCGHRPLALSGERGAE
ncbi:MAG: hypothetical protein WC483_05650 [Candidatus Paceibacterota bacterium]